MSGKYIQLDIYLPYIYIPMSTVQRTLVVLKPDTVGRSITGEIISRFERAGLHIVGMKMVKPDKDFLFHHYETISQMISRRGQAAFDSTLNFMMKTPLIAIVLEGVEVVEYVRKLIGTTEPKTALPGTIRGDYAHMSLAYANGQNVALPNLIHASGNEEEAKAEIAHWFTDAELFGYPQIQEIYMR